MIKSAKKIIHLRPIFAAAAVAMLAACGMGEADDAGHAGLPGGADDAPFSAIAQGEHIEFTGTEPFWGGEITGGTLIYRTPDDADGSAIEVERFAGRGGLSFSGKMDAKSFDLMITPGVCSDGMSDKNYPFTATLQLGEEIRLGCAWSAGNPPRDTVQPLEPL